MTVDPDDGALARYDAFARRIVEGKILTDPWVSGKPRFRQEPILLTLAEQRSMYRAAEEVAEVYNELCLVVSDHPELAESYFGLTPWERAMWLSSAPMWHGIARADVFVTDEGVAIAELNCDTPTGEAEAVELNALVREEHRDAVDPNRELEGRFVAMVLALAEHELGTKDISRVGIVYPTEMTDDLSVIRLYRKWLSARGLEVVLGSPYNLTYEDGQLALLGTPISVALRHYKTDWWGERVSAWDDDVIADTAPLEAPLRAAIESSVERRCSIVNPFGAVLPQNKRAMAFMWEHLHRFSPRAADIIARVVPVTSRLETMHEEQLRVQKDEWVLKSDYGAEGEEVVIGARVTEEVWKASLLHARPGKWVAQRYFHAKTNGRGETVNYGVYLVAGEAAGIYARADVGPTDAGAMSVPVLIKGSDSPP